MGNKTKLEITWIEKETGQGWSRALFDAQDDIDRRRLSQAWEIA